MKNRKIDSNVLRLLYAHSGNRCAFDGCYSPIFEDDDTLTGECCHIEALSPDGPRYNVLQSDEERNGYNNLVLMCARHHKIIDKNPQKYPVDLLKRMKREHETQFNARQAKATEMMLYQLQVDSQRYWQELSLKDTLDNTGRKMKLGDQDIRTLVKEIDLLFKNLSQNVDHIINSYKQLQSDLKVECEKCGIDYHSFDKIPIYENSLQNRDWEVVKIGLPNCATKLEMRYLQLCILLLEMIIKKDQAKPCMDLLDTYKRKLKEFHEGTYYCD